MGPAVYANRRKVRHRDFVRGAARCHRTARYYSPPFSPRTMQSRDALLLIGALCLFAGVGVVFLGKESMAEEIPPSANAPVEPVGPRPMPAAPVDAVVAPTGDEVAPVTATMSRKERSVGDRALTGTVRGDIQLAVSVLDRIGKITIHVEEARRPVNEKGEYFAPRKFTVPATMGLGTPTFEVTGIPFSEYPWVVTAFAPGLNGTQRTIVLNEQTPVVDDIVLAITPGGPFTVLLRDQDLAPYSGVDVLMQPVGEPLGRAPQRGVSDNFGSVVFENVLAGEWTIHASQGGQALVDPSRISMQPGTSVVSPRFQTQGCTVTIPRGFALQLRIADVNGYGLADATASATATDRSKLTVLEAASDHGGNLAFPHLTPGEWQIDVMKTDFQRSTRKITIKVGELPDVQEFRLVRLR